MEQDTMFFPAEEHEKIISDEESFLKNWGQETMRWYLATHIKYITSFGIGNNDYATVEQHYRRRYEQYAGYAKWTFIDDYYSDAASSGLEIFRYTDIIRINTKRIGESRSWLEIGLTKEYISRNGSTYKRWIADELRFPNRDKRLIVQSLWFPNCVRNVIYVAPDYPLEIRVASRGPVLKNKLISSIDGISPQTYVDTTERIIWQPQKHLFG